MANFLSKQLRKINISNVYTLPCSLKSYCPVGNFSRLNNDAPLKIKKNLKKKNQPNKNKKPRHCRSGGLAGALILSGYFLR